MSSKDAAGAERWRELLDGKRCWIATDASADGLARFMADIIEPLKAMDAARIIQIELLSHHHNGRLCASEVRVVDVASWVFGLAGPERPPDKNPTTGQVGPM